MSPEDPVPVIVLAGFSTSETIIAFFILAFLLMCSAFISGAESAFFSLTPSDKDELKNSPAGSSTTVLRLLEKPKELLATILITNNFVNVGIVILSSYILSSLLPEDISHTVHLLVEFVGITLVLLLIGEVIPKIYATKNSLTFSRFMARPLSILNAAPPLSWLKNVLVSGTGFINRYAGKKGVRISSHELEQAIALTKEETTSEEEHRILEGIAKFGNTEVRQIMRSRMDVVAFDSEMQYDEILEEILSSGYSRIPVYEGTFDNVIGILFIKDLLPHLHEANDFNYRGLLRKPFFVPENKKIDDLLKEFQSRKVHMAVVVDEYGGASGVVTLEDVLEEIVGDITDEFDDDEIIYTRIDENTFLFEGRTALIDMYKVLEIDGREFESNKGDADSIGGFIIEKSGRILRNNEYITFNDLRLVVESSDKRRIKMVKVILPKEKIPER